MANRLKSKKAQTAVSGKLKPEKESRVTAGQLVRDERTHKITGAFCLLLAAFLFIAFTSYLFTWKEDQDKVFQGASILWPSSNVKVTNLLGNLGALVSHEFFFKGFGVTSYLFCSFFFIVGVNLLFARRIFSISRNLRYVLAGLLYFSVAFAFITHGNGFSWGGAVGDMMSDWLTRFLGWIGTAALLFVAGLAYFIWRFNPVFKMPALPVREKAAVPEPVAVEVSEKPAKGKKGAKLFVDEEFSQAKGNTLKDDGGVIATAAPVVEEEALIDFTVVEREPEEEEEEEMEEVFEEEEVEEEDEPAAGAGELQLEIKSAPEVAEGLPEGEGLLSREGSAIGGLGVAGGGVAG